MVTEVDGLHVLGALSPSRAGDFKTCPLLYRFRTVDKLPEPPSRDALRGTVVHKVLEDLFDLPGPDRVPERALGLVADAWAQVQEAEPGVGQLFAKPDGTVDEAARDAWLTSCDVVLERYFGLEDPRRLEPAAREEYVEALLDSKLLLRGYVDRIDVAPDGAIRVVDYKTSRSPGERFEAKALFQMRFYALVLWRARGAVPAMLRLIYLGNGELVEYVPDEQDLLATERQLLALWEAIRTARETGDWQPQRSALCGWCSFQALCPAFGGTPPPLPAPEEPSEGEHAAADLPGRGTDGVEDDPVGP